VRSAAAAAAGRRAAFSSSLAGPGDEQGSLLAEVAGFVPSSLVRVTHHYCSLAASVSRQRISTASVDLTVSRSWP
jgi:hypothetical protein